MDSLEHWDVNNENLHGQWYQNQLNDRDYDLELFRMMYQADSYPKLFLNDYEVVGSGAATNVSTVSLPSPPLPPLSSYPRLTLIPFHLEPFTDSLSPIRSHNRGYH